ncbi:hypothetical protein GCM10020295_35030 [Streptomyces cinereospinus]
MADRLVEDQARGGAHGGRAAGDRLGDGVRVGGGAGLADGAQRLGTRARGGHLACPGAQRLLRRVPVPSREQRAGQRERRTPLLGREVAVAAGQGQAVVLPHGRDADDLDAEVQVPHHAADQGELLGVLLAEERHVGAGEVEQLGDDREHAVEVAGAGGALQALPHGAGADPHLGCAARVDLVRGGGRTRRPRRPARRS